MFAVGKSIGTEEGKGNRMPSLSKASQQNRGISPLPVFRRFQCIFIKAVRIYATTCLVLAIVPTLSPHDIAHLDGEVSLREMSLLLLLLLGDASGILWA